MRVPDQILIVALICRELWRRFSRRLRSGPLYRWRFSGGVPGELTVAPQDLRPADPELALSIYSGHFIFGQDSVNTDAASPFLIPPPSHEWLTRLHSFRWLRHLREADTDLSRVNASALVSDWIETWGSQLSSDAWGVGIVSARMISWFNHAPLLISNNSPETYRAVLKSLSRQSRYLNHNVPHIRDGYPRLHATIALAYASLCLSGREKNIRYAAKELDRELERQIFPDGGHISRNPSILLEILADLLPLKRVYLKMGHSPSPALLSAIDRMMGALRFMRHSNGDLAQFNGTGFTNTALLTTILRYDETHGDVAQTAPHSGYERLSAGKTVLLVDVGRPFSRSTARQAMAGTLSFELSSGSTRFVANCGIPESRSRLYAPFARATAAHTTVTINDKSSSHFARETWLHKFLPSPLIRSPHTVASSRDVVDGYKHLKASHDGYAKSAGFIHHRELFLGDDGNKLNGSDTFEQTGKPARRRDDSNHSAAIRFHLPPSISASPLTSGQSILIASANKQAWVFTCVDAKVTLEESIQFSGPGEPRKSEQIVIYVDPVAQDNVRWTFERRATNSSAPRDKGQTKNSGDLLGLFDNNGADPGQSQDS